MQDAPDFADHAVAQWQRQRPELDFSAMGPLARFARLGLLGQQLVDGIFAAESLDRGEFDVLATLRRSGPDTAVTPSRLAESLLTTRGGMSKRIDRLEARTLVRRAGLPGDRRSQLISLTPDGLALIDRLVERHAANESRLLNVLSPEDLAGFDRALRRLLAALPELLDAPQPEAGPAIR
ncbi:MarR family winged helix-turn-helix transcriptional regulator [Agromyces bauzanensis]|uniref:MarR family transcriptional regulator n=1 Tax=Agromyces bauzanensis TaxID=1308924 RepID=A0A917PL10_9MICO|nr:MarR family transcriptional regulator [Agromyces bauzanensis]GGJ83291.1 MarR family transcriptional regulator [Agromyces bauzanensis]